MAGIRRGQGREIALAAALLGALLFVILSCPSARAQTEFGGIGIRFTMEDGRIKVHALIDNTPAAKAGIMAGDLITELDGESVQGLTVPQAVDKMRGPVNTTIKLTIMRKGQDKPIELTLVRQTIIIRSALYERPVLIVDPGMHTVRILAAAVDAAGRFVVTGSDDKTVRVWSADDGRLLQTIRPPAGPGDVGKIYAVAMSPDGDLVAAGGFTRTTTEKELPIYLFDRRTGKMTWRIASGLPGIASHLVFSADGRYLAAVLSSGGLRVYDRDNKWSEVFRDTDYESDSRGAAFASDGRLATTAYDGKVRLYDSSFKLVGVKETASGRQPLGIAFSPDGKVLAIGYYDVAAVDLFDAQTLAAVPGPTTDGVTGSLFQVAWSQDGQTLFAGGKSIMLFAWADAGLGKRRALSVGRNTITSVVALPEGQLLAATTDPYLTVLEADGTPRWAHDRPRADFRGPLATRVSTDGAVLDFGFHPGGKFPLRFDLKTFSLSRDPPADGSARPPKQDGLSIDHWVESYSPMLNGKPIELDRMEMSRSLAIHPDGKRFILGTEWSLRAFDAEGKPLWRRPVPGIVWAVNVTGNGRIVVSAYGDGTIRWHRMDDGRELLALMVLNDKQNWVAWTPEGFYAATPGAYGVLRWQVNHGVDAVATTVPVSAIPKLRRPDALPLVLEELETARALGVADLAAARRDVQEATGAAEPPGARLHVLAIGINDYGDKAKNLHLDFASKDASDVFNALVNTQDSRFNKLGGLYAEVLAQALPDELATKQGIFDALEAMKLNMAKDTTNDDLAVVMFSGHGAIVDGQLYLLPYNVDASTPSHLKVSAIGANELQAELAELAKHGRVLVLLDACHSGAVTGDGTQIVPSANLLRSALVASNVTVLTSSDADEVSHEDAQWGHGAFSKVLLAALGRDADTNNDGLISMSELTAYLSAKVPELTGGHQHVGLSQGFQRELFVAGL
jgi:WD40 repeat protein